MAWQNPKTDWNINPKSPMSVDFNRIEGNIQYVLDQIEAKKGIIVNAINEKEEVVTIENSYQELANAIGVLNENPRVANGTSELVFVPPVETRQDYYGQIMPERAHSAKIQVLGLPFKPAKLSAMGKLRVQLSDTTLPGDPPWIETWIEYQWGIIHNTLANPSTKGVWLDGRSGMAYYKEQTASLSVNITFQDDGFTLMLSAIAPSNKQRLMLYTDSKRFVNWFVEE